MGMVKCAACGEMVTEFDTYFSDQGTVCADCHTLEEQKDRDEFRAGSENYGDVRNDAITVEREESEHYDEQGNRVTVVRTTTVNGGLFGLLYRLFRLFTGK